MRKHALHLPSGDSDVIGLVEKGMLRKVGDEPVRIYYGTFLPYMIDADARATVTSTMIGFPEKDPTEEEHHWLVQNRPAWVVPLEEHMSGKLGKKSRLRPLDR
jgi:hypothetical protein